MKTKTKMMEVLIRVFGFNMVGRLYIGVDQWPKALKTIVSMIGQYIIVLMSLALGGIMFQWIDNSMYNVLKESLMIVYISVMPLLITFLISFLVGGYVIAYYYNKWITKRLQIV